MTLYKHYHERIELFGEFPSWFNGDYRILYYGENGYTPVSDEDCQAMKYLVERIHAASRANDWDAECVAQNALMAIEGKYDDLTYEIKVRDVSFSETRMHDDDYVCEFDDEFIANVAPYKKKINSSGEFSFGYRRKVRNEARRELLANAKSKRDYLNKKDYLRYALA